MNKRIAIRIGLLAALAAVTVLWMYFPKDSTQLPVTGLEIGALMPLNAMPEERTVIAKDESTELYMLMNTQYPGFELVNKQTQEIWKSYTSAEYYTKAAENSMQYLQISSPFTINYTDYENESGMAYCGQNNNTVSYEFIKNGVRLLCEFPDYGIQVTVCVTLNDGNLEVDIPFNGIRENSRFGLVSIDIFPAFEASLAEENGYIFIPDGSGAIFPLNQNKADIKLRSFHVYSPENINLNTLHSDTEKGIYNASVPVFGMKRGGKGFVGFVANGAAESVIKFAPAGYRLDMYRIYSSIKLRQWYSFTTEEGVEILNVDSNIIKNDFKIVYAPLSGNKADYSGMAQEYRKYLLDNDQLVKRVEENSDMPIGIDFLMGIKDNALLFSKYLPITTFSNVEDAMDRWNVEGLNNVQTILHGWQSKGYGVYPSSSSVSKRLGGLNGLKGTGEQASSQGYSLFLADNYTMVTDSGNASQSNLVKTIIKDLLTDSLKSKYLLTPLAVQSNVKKAVKTLESTSIAGLAFDRLGKDVYEDFSLSAPVRSQDTIGTWESLMGFSKEVFGAVAVEGANSYAFAYADRLYSVPDKSSQYVDFSQSVPFIQLLLHGYIPYSSGYGNLTSDIQLTKLKWVEFGTMPTFILTREDSSQLKQTDMKKIFDSDYEKWTEYAITLYKELNQNLKSIVGKPMVEHEILQDDVVRVTYEGGTQVYINYSDSKVFIDQVTIPSLDYVVLESEVQ